MNSLLVLRLVMLKLLTIIFALNCKSQHSIGVNTGVFTDGFISEQKVVPYDFNFNASLFYKYAFGQESEILLSALLGQEYRMAEPNYEGFEYYFFREYTLVSSIFVGYTLYNYDRHSFNIHLGPTFRSNFLTSHKQKEIDGVPSEIKNWFEQKQVFLDGTLLLEYNLGLGSSRFADYKYVLSFALPISYLQRYKGEVQILRFTPSIGIQWNFGSGGYF